MENLDVANLEKIFWGISIVFSLILIIQTVLAFMGVGDYDLDAPDVDGVLDFDADTGNFPLLSIRNFVVFFTVFGWSGIVGIRLEFTMIRTIAFALIMGFITMLIVAYIYYMFLKMASERTDKIEYALGKVGDVYLRIPPQNTGKGKVQLAVQGAIRELAAITDSKEELKTGTTVKVIEIIDDELVKVEKI